MKVKIRPKNLPKSTRITLNFFKRAKASNAGTDKHHSAYFNRDPCVYCGRSRFQRKKWSIEHVLPIANGGRNSQKVGPYTIDNLVNSCYSCNVNRSNIPLLVWLTLLNKNQGSVILAVKEYHHLKRKLKSETR